MNLSSEKNRRRAGGVFQTARKGLLDVNLITYRMWDVYGPVNPEMESREWGNCLLNVDLIALYDYSS